MSIAVCTAPFILLVLPCPMYFAMTTFAPTEIPIKRFNSRFISAPFPPTAACAVLLANLPTTATSTALNICCNILLSAIGIANISILSVRLPFNISICLFLLTVTLLIFIKILSKYIKSTLNYPKIQVFILHFFYTKTNKSKNQLFAPAYLITFILFFQEWILIYISLLYFQPLFMTETLHFILH